MAALAAAGLRLCPLARSRRYSAGNGPPDDLLHRAEHCREWTEPLPAKKDYWLLVICAGRGLDENDVATAFCQELLQAGEVVVAASCVALHV
jgi:hypothetical protein